MIVLARVRQRSLIAFRDFTVISILVQTVRPSLRCLVPFSLGIWKITQICKCIDTCVGLSGVHAEIA